MRLSLKLSVPKSPTNYEGIMPSPEKLRQEAAELAGYSLDTLPSAKLLDGTVRWLFSLLEDKDGSVHRDRILAASLAYDDRIEEDGILETLEEIGVEKTRLQLREFYNWVILMFGECSEEEFIGGTSDFGDAARAVMFEQ